MNSEKGEWLVLSKGRVIDEVRRVTRDRLCRILPGVGSQCDMVNLAAMLRTDNMEAKMGSRKTSEVFQDSRRYNYGQPRRW